jgi:hypothetical protein
MAIIKERVTAKIEGDFVVFLIGMRINKPWMIHKWLPVALAMGPMLKELYKNPDSGFIGSKGAFPWLIQYWRSFDHLAAYARQKDATHFPNWVKFNKRISASAAVGIWHETYMVKDGQYETIYNNMPPSGLGQFVPLVPAKGKYGSSRSRAGKVEHDDAPVTPEGHLVA